MLEDTDGVGRHRWCWKTQMVLETQMVLKDTDGVGRHRCEVLALSNKAIFLLIPQTMTPRKKFCANSAICDKRPTARMPRTVL
jgi:hypothetical protein